MFLATLYSTSQLFKVLKKKYGLDSQIKVKERKNSEGEDVIEITIVKVLKNEKPKKRVK